MFELEKERIKKSLLEKPNLDYQKYYKQKLDELYTLSIYCLSTKLSYIAGTTMLLPIYLASRHVCYSIQLLNSVVKEVMLDPVNLPYDKYIKKFEELINDFKLAPSDIPPIYYDESEWNGYDFQKTFGDEITNLFPSFTLDVYWDDRERIFPDYESGTFEQTIETSLKNSMYLTKGIVNYFNEIICGLYEISDYLDSRLDYSQSLKDIFKQRINDYMSSSRWVDARNEVYNEIRLLGTGKDIVQVLNSMKIQYFYHLKKNRLGTLFMQTNRVEFFIFDLDNPVERATQSELNEFFKLHCQYELVCKLLDYKSQWSVKNEYDLFINKGTEYIVNSLVLYLAAKIGFNSRKSYAALWLALLDLNLLNRTEAGLFKEWLNKSFLKDAPNDSSRKGKMKDDKSIRGAVDDMYKFQFHGIQKKFKDLTSEEIAQLKNGENLKPLYRNCIILLSKAFGVNLEKQKFQLYITEYSEKEELLKDFPKDEQSSNILECFKAYEDFTKYQFITNQ